MVANHLNALIRSLIKEGKEKDDDELIRNRDVRIVNGSGTI